jgi:lysozyme
MMIDPKLVADIDASESCKLDLYPDSLGVPTIGWGHAMPGQSYPLHWTQEQADAQRDTDITFAQTFAMKLPEWSALDTACRQNAMVELCFNMRGKWLTFVNTRNAIKTHDWRAAHDGLLASLWASEVHATRANRLANYLLTGQYP